MGCLRTWSTCGRRSDAARTVGALSISIWHVPATIANYYPDVRRGFSLRPNLTAIIGVLACASAAPTLLNLIHPYDAAATDFTVHAFTVIIVIIANIHIRRHVLISSSR